MKQIVFTIFILSLYGCASSIAINERLSEKSNESHEKGTNENTTPLDVDTSVYPATKLDYVAFQVFCCSDYIDTESKQPLSAHIFTKTVVPLMCIVDLPFSIVSDTLLFPFDLYAIQQKEGTKEQPNHTIKAEEN
ncbi:YceK/YidQ family lipoprotein [Desulfuromonas sp. KJ2020]|uniref:YceK/YidQ family lipoprotein n=1 Tax=Desulfuromonas sp. KJ2020 TaxID=2919173 RepID=UPI0020A7ED26|nr:YceK/YidQ family lipoprotein [Desulfuromonas sp. KJ2020]MCP3176525.1 YceK/YidQ family lipoprotein [Desulfuromonas sp. KJ2020]